MEKATAHIDLWTVAYVLNDHVGVFRALDPHIVPVDLPQYMKASFICEHDLFQVIFVVLYATEHFQGKCHAFGCRLVWVLAESAPYKHKASVFYAKSCVQLWLVVPVLWMCDRFLFCDFVEMIQALVQHLLHLCLVDQYFSVSDNI